MSFSKINNLISQRNEVIKVINNIEQDMVNEIIEISDFTSDEFILIEQTDGLCIIFTDTVCGMLVNDFLKHLQNKASKDEIKRSSYL